ncbi:ATP-binding protein [Synechococcus sp. RC10B2]|uniref:ATP-binding protein n=1 Tax=unclassified Synechococcus TaxID=2626047 RepID=UPI0039C6027F
MRTTSLPGGERTQKLWQKFLEEGGIHWRPSEEEIRVLLALEQLQSRPGFTDWLAERQPLAQLAAAEPDSGLAKLLAWLKEGIPAQETPKVEPAKKGDFSLSRVENGKAPQAKQDLHLTGLLVGRRWVANREGDPVFLPVPELVRHTVILAGSGSGKTVLLRRMVEEAALQGIPSIVIDAANDLARLGDPWPAAPEGWTEEDQAKAERYFAQTEVVVWTPGLAAGNPLTLAPLPDFAALAGDPEELDQAVDMAWGALQEIVAPGKTVSDELKRGVLKAALKYFATHQPGSLADFAEFLADLPPEAGAGISKAPQLALQMANLLKAAMVNNKLLHQQGMALDPAILLGLGSDYGKTRVSVVNLVGLPTLGEQQQFLNQLAMALFTWIKKNPAPPEAPVRGLLVIDEAKDFVPSQGTTPCKQSLLRLAAQARKYGLGLIFATQAPKSIDHNVIANCSTQFFGRVTSPAAIEVVREQIAQRGGSGEDVAVLKVGQFYLSSQQLHPPCKIQTPWCLSFHAPTPLSEAEVIQRSQGSQS